MGAYILRFPRAQVLTLVFLGFFITTVRIPSFSRVWFVQQALYGVASLNAPSNIGMEVVVLLTGHTRVALYLGQFSVLCWDYLDLNSKEQYEHT